MKLRGAFVVRQVMENTVAVPVGQTALHFNGMILLNNVSKVLWEALTRGSTVEEMTATLTELFDVSREEATADILEFLEKLHSMQMLEES